MSDERAARLLKEFRAYIATPRRWSNAEFEAFRSRCAEFFDATDLDADEITAQLWGKMGGFDHRGMVYVSCRYPKGLAAVETPEGVVICWISDDVEPEYADEIAAALNERAASSVAGSSADRKETE